MIVIKADIKFPKEYNILLPSPLVIPEINCKKIVAITCNNKYHLHCNGIKYCIIKNAKLYIKHIITEQKKVVEQISISFSLFFLLVTKNLNTA